MPEPVLRENRFVEGGYGPRLKYLKPEQLAMIEDALRNLGEYGEVRLVVEKGRLRFIVTQKSYDVLKWQAGELK